MNKSTTLTLTERPSGVKVVKIIGDLDSMGTHTVEKQLGTTLEDATTIAIVDLSAVHFISSAGMAMLLVRGKTLRRSGGQMVILATNSRVIEVLSLAGFNELFDVYQSLEEALSAVEA